MHDVAAKMLELDALAMEGNESPPVSLPSSWQMKRVGDVAHEFISGGTPATERPELWDGSIPWTTSAPIGEQATELHSAQRFITEQALSASATHIVAHDNLLVGTRVGVGKAVVNCLDIAISQDLTGVVLDSTQVQPAFVAFQFKTGRVQNFFNARKRGTTIKGISRFDLQELPLYLPPLPEQRAIARILRTVQDAIQARRREAELERERKATLMQHLFTYGTRGEPTKVTEIGEMPESWRVVTFAEAVDIVQGQVDPKVEPYRSMLHVGPENIEEATGRLLPARTAAELNLISGKYLFSPEHVLYSKIRPYLRKATIPTFTGICSADMYPVCPRPHLLLRDFLLPVLLSEQFTSQVTASQDRTGIPKVNRDQLGSVRLPIPTLDEQHTLGSILSACDARVVASQHEEALLGELFRALLEELMTGRLSALPLVETAVAAEIGAPA